MVQDGSVLSQEGHPAPPRMRLTTYFGIGLALVVAAIGLRKGALWRNDPFRLMERKIGFHLYQPAFLPYRMELADNGIVRGAYRIVWAYTSEEYSLHVGQERRNPERDDYNKREFEGQSAQVNGRPAMFTRDQFGHWRLFWQTDDATLILTSANLNQKEMIQIAESMQ